MRHRAGARRATTRDDLRRALMALCGTLLIALPTTVLAQPAPAAPATARPAAPAAPPAAPPKADPAAKPDPTNDAFLPPVDAPFIPIEGKWPARWGEAERGARGVIIPITTPITQLRTVYVDDALAPALATQQESDAALLANGVTAPRPPLVHVGPGSILFRELPPEQRSPGGFGIGPSAVAGAKAEVFRFVSGEVDDAGNLRLSTTWFAYYAPSVKPDAPRAVLMLVPGMFGTPEPVIDPLIMQLRASGWGVLRMLCLPSRFTEDVFINVAPGDARSPGNVASIFSDRAAEASFAADAAWQYLESRRPEVKKAPKAALGMSGGAMTLPTTLALHPDRYDAAVIIGGGCDFWLISQRSNYRRMIDSIKLVVPSDAPPNWPTSSAEFDRAYLDAAPFDSFNTALATRSIRWLIIQGGADQAVPASLGEILWKRLGSPERWMRAAGHEALFMALPMDFKAIVDWLAWAALGDERSPVLPALQTAPPEAGK